MTTVDSIGDYLRQIARFPLLSATDERRLCEQIEAARHALETAVREHGDDAPAVQERRSDVRRLEQQLIEANLRLVVAIAKRYRYDDIPLLDHVQDGNVGLMKAVERYDYHRGFK